MADVPHEHPRSASPYTSSLEDGEHASHRHNSGERLKTTPTATRSTIALDQSSPVPPRPSKVQSLRRTVWRAISMIVTISLCILIGIVVKIYSSDHAMPRNKKHLFETFTTALLIFLGLNFLEVFQSLSVRAKDKILNSRQWGQADQDFIHGIHSFKTILNDIFWSRAGWLVRILGVTWLLLALIAQVVIALISLTYTAQGASDYKGAYTAPGSVIASDLTCYHAFYNSTLGCGGGDPQFPALLANTWGRAADAYKCCEYSDISEVENSQEDCDYYCNYTPNKQEFAYRFKEYNPRDETRTYPHLTKRYITSSSAPCRVYFQKNRKDLPRGILNFTFSSEDEAYTSWMTIPLELTSEDGTQYIYRGRNPPPGALTYACGDRCITMWAHKSRGPNTKEATFYECNVTVNEVQNMDHSETQAIGNDVARLAAASIALSGRPRGENNWAQFQSYTYGSRRDVHHNTTDQVGAIMAEFAIGSLSFMAAKNPTIRMQGQVPRLGSRLDVKWKSLVAILAGVSLTHLVVWVICEWVERDKDANGSFWLWIVGMGRKRSGGWQQMGGNDGQEVISEVPMLTLRRA